MAQESEQDVRRFEKIDRAISRDIERRQRTGRWYWGLLAMVAAVAAYVAIFGMTTADKIAEDDGLRKELTQEMSRNPGLQNEVTEKLGANEELQTALSGRLGSDSNLQSALTEKLLTAPDLRAGLTSELSADTGFQSMLADQLGENAALQSGVTDKLSNSERLVSGVAASPAVKRAILARTQQIAETLDNDVAAIQATHRDTEVRLNRRIDSLTASITALQLQLDALQAVVPTLQERVAVAGRHRLSYILKERATTALADLPLSVTLGRRRGDGVESVVFRDAQGRPLTSSATANVPFGKRFHVVDVDGNAYDVLLSYAQSRFIARDYIGLEVIPQPAHDASN